MATFNLDDIRKAADAKYVSVEITFGNDDRVRLVNALRLPQERRDGLTELQEKMDKASREGGDQVALLEGGIRLVADNEDAVERLLVAVGGDLAVLAALFEKYATETQAGEA